MTAKTKRWTVLLAVSLVMMMGYVFWDIVSPVSTQLKAPLSEGGMAWTAAEYGFYAGSYSIFNIFFLMLFFGGIILDRCGIRITGLLATGSMLLGAAVNAWAITHISPTTMVDMPFTLFGIIPEQLKTQVLVAALGFGFFGMGCDITGITVSKIVTKWFKGKELASAMGVQVALARLGTASALSLSPLLAQTWGLPSPIIAGTLLLLVGFVIFVGYCFADKHFDEHEPEVFEEKATNDEPFRWHDFTALLRNPSFWLIALLCVSYYSSIRPFMKFATDLLVNKYHADALTAGWLVSIIPYGSIVLTPLFGMLYDRIGRGVSLMLIGSAMLTAVHVCFALPIAWSGTAAIVLMVILGIAFSLVPSALWPSVPKIVPLKQLGTAYSIIYYIQNIGLMLVPMIVGGVLKDDTTAGVPVFTRTMWIFAAFGLAAVVFAIVMLIAERKNHYGLEEANINPNA
ncbi:MAG: MFS transporter [Prevotella sp.]|jgi:nitrate/nitrite transporter NarK